MMTAEYQDHHETGYFGNNHSGLDRHRQIFQNPTFRVLCPGNHVHAHALVLYQQRGLDSLNPALCCLEMRLAFLPDQNLEMEEPDQYLVVELFVGRSRAMASVTYFGKNSTCFCCVAVVALCRAEEAVAELEEPIRQHVLYCQEASFERRRVLGAHENEPV
jgi:hypothetical protein